MHDKVQVTFDVPCLLFSTWMENPVVNYPWIYSKSQAKQNEGKTLTEEAELSDLTGNVTVLTGWMKVALNTFFFLLVTAT